MAIRAGIRWGWLGLAAACVGPHDGPQAVAAVDWRYHITVDADAAMLDVVASFDGAAIDAVTIPAACANHVSKVRLQGRRGEEILGGDLPWRVNPREGVVRLRYRFDLAAAARDANVRGIQDHSGVVLALPASYLVRPTRLGARAVMAVATRGDTEFASGLFPSDRVAGAVTFEPALLQELPWTAWGKLRRATIAVAGGELQVAFLPGRRALDDDTLIDWITDRVTSVTDYYGRLPVPRALLIVRAQRGRGVSEASARGRGGVSLMMSVGDRTRVRDLRRDWKLTHELVHLALPNVLPQHHWLEEGLATYLEPIVRARSGSMSEQAVWREWLGNMEKGQVAELGLDQNTSWQNTYWGGAFYCMRADLLIRQRTGNRHGLATALRAIVAHGGSLAASWSLDRVLATGDAATGETVLRELYDEMGVRHGRVDLDQIWRQLGVSMQGRRVVFDDDAPLAALRRDWMGG